MSGAPQFPIPPWVGAQPLRPGGAAHKAGPTLEQRIEALERGALGRPGPGVVDGCTITSDIASQGGAKWQPYIRGIIVPNATLGTNKTQAGFPGGTWARMYGTGLYKAGDYLTGATLVDHADGAQYIQIDTAGMYVFQVNHSLTFPSSVEVGYGLTTKAEFDGGVPYRDTHNHEKPYAATTDYKTRTFIRYCAAGDLVAPTLYFSGATGNVVHNNQTTSRCAFSFVRVSA